MKTSLLTLMLLIFIAEAATAQKIRYQDYELPVPANKLPASPYSSMEFLDSRADTALGNLFHVGFFSSGKTVVAGTPLKTQFQHIFNALVDSSAQKGSLLLQIRKIKFIAEGITRECGIFSFTANLYVKLPAGYQRIAGIDTTISNFAQDATPPTLATGTDIVDSFMIKHLLDTPVDTALYSFRDIQNIDSTEESKLALYNTYPYIDGVYKTYSSFEKQLPDYTDMQIKNSDSVTISAVKLKDSTRKLKKIDPKDLYAVVYHGRAFIATAFGFYHAEQLNNEFYFSGYDRIALGVICSEVIPLQAVLGGSAGNYIGRAVEAEGNVKARFRMEIDHQNGQFLHLSRVAFIPDAPDGYPVL